MAETQEYQELEDIQSEETDGVDDTLMQSEETDGVDDTLEENEDQLAFLRDNSDDFNLYQAFKAFHYDRNYEDAIEKFQSTIEYEKKQGEPSEVDVDAEEKTNEGLAKSFYWLAESHLKMQQSDQAVEIFETLARDFANHFLGQAAQRRADRLKTKN